MTFEEIVIFAQDRGFQRDLTKTYYIFTLERKDNVVVEMSFPDDRMSKELRDGEAISWEYRLIDRKTHNVIYKDWLEHYGSPAQELIKEMKEDVTNFIDKISTLDIRVKEKAVVTIFGLKIGKYTELNFNTKNGWQTLWGNAA